MTGYEGPGEGWREVTPSEYLHARHLGHRTLVQEVGVPLSTDMVKTYWTREEPAPELPTEAYTVIRATFGHYENVCVLLDAGWINTAGQPVRVERITGFEVLAEPSSRYDDGYAQGKSDAGRARDQVRRETAEAVLDRVRELVTGKYFRKTLSDIAREFGIEL